MKHSLVELRCKKCIVILLQSHTSKFEKLKTEATKMAKDAEARATQMAHEGKAKAEELKSGVTHAAQSKLNEVRADGRSMVS